MDEKLKRQKEIHEKGFGLGTPHDYGRIRVGKKSLKDATYDIDYGDFKKLNRYNPKINKLRILKALAENDVNTLVDISNYFYSISGIYERICNLFAYLYRYDWYITPQIIDKSVKGEKATKDFYKVLNYFDNTHIKKLCGDIALKVIKNGCYYGYLVPSKDFLSIQELPIKYCRSRYKINNMPAVEFNMKFFDEHFTDPEYRMRILNLFPEEFKKGYSLYKLGKLPPDYIGDSWGAWYLLDINSTVKFTIKDGDLPMFVSSIPAILDLDAAQDIDKRRQMQKLLKIVVQKMPLDSNGDLIFDVDEIADFHNNAVQMLKNAEGVDVLTTVAEVLGLNLYDSVTSTTSDDLERVERTVYNSFGVSQNLFNTDGNLSLEKSILNDESAIRNLLLQFHIFFDRILQKLTQNKKKMNYRFYMLETTQYNYKELSKMYKEQVQIGYSKMLPQIALGHTQSSIIHTAFFENEILTLSDIMIPPLMSSTMSSQNLGKITQKANNNSDNNQGGRPEKDDDKKSTKTIQNKESMN